MISVIVPIYNVEKYITKCLESIVNQSYKDFELLLVNDGSTDNSVSVIRNYLVDKQVNWKIIDKKNGGQSSARNIGLKNAIGDYIVFIDSDDVISCDFLDELLSCFSEDIDFSFCNFQYVKEQIPPVDNINERKEYTKNELLKSFLVRDINFILPSMMFKREFLLKNKLILNENIKFSEDQMFMWEVIFKSSKSIYLYKKMYGYYLREKSIMTSSPYQKIIKGFEEYKIFVSLLENNYPDFRHIIKYILPRWKLGVLYTSANLLSREEFNKLFNKLDGKQILDIIKSLKDRNSCLLALVAKISPNLLYLLCRKLNLNE